MSQRIWANAAAVRFPQMCLALPPMGALGPKGTSKRWVRGLHPVPLRYAEFGLRGGPRPRTKLGGEFCETFSRPSGGLVPTRNFRYRSRCGTRSAPRRTPAGGAPWAPPPPRGPIHESKWGQRRNPTRHLVSPTAKSNPKICGPRSGEGKRQRAMSGPPEFRARHR